MSEPASLQALLRVPLDAKRVKTLQDLVDEHPDHWFRQRGPFLEFHAEAAA